MKMKNEKNIIELKLSLKKLKETYLNTQLFILQVADIAILFVLIPKLSRNISIIKDIAFHFDFRTNGNRGKWYLMHRHQGLIKTQNDR